MKPWQWSGWSHNLTVLLGLTLRVGGRHRFPVDPFSWSTLPSDFSFLSLVGDEGSHVRPRHEMLYYFHLLA